MPWWGWLITTAVVLGIIAVIFYIYIGVEISKME